MLSTVSCYISNGVGGERSGSFLVKTIRIRPKSDPDPQHWAEGCIMRAAGIAIFKKVPFFSIKKDLTLYKRFSGINARKARFEFE
jgi:hypothetical protein